MPHLDHGISERKRVAWSQIYLDTGVPLSTDETYVPYILFRGFVSSSASAARRREFNDVSRQSTPPHAGEQEALVLARHKDRGAPSGLRHGLSRRTHVPARLSRDYQVTTSGCNSRLCP